MCVTRGVLELANSLQKKLNCIMRSLQSQESTCIRYLLKEGRFAVGTLAPN